MALGLGITGDVPPTSLQPHVRGGVHIRYATSFARGLPWFGFYLFRRPRRTRLETCLAQQLARLKPAKTGKTRLDLAGISFTAAAPIELIEQPGTPGTTGIALPSDDRIYLLVDLFGLPYGNVGWPISSR
jgi:hypothetical protein